MNDGIYYDANHGVHQDGDGGVYLWEGRKMSETLRPCPFCGETAEIKVVDGSWGYYPDRVTVGCKTCDIEFSEWVENDRGRTNQSTRERATAKAARRWNTRK